MTISDHTPTPLTNQDPAGPVHPAPAPVDAQAPTDAVPQGYKDTDLVYVDPDTKSVIGAVEWSRNGNPKSKPFVHPPVDKDGKERRFGRKHYPWGTYKSMKGAFKLEGKKKHEANKTLEDILPKALKDPFWD